ncbi:MAG: DUF1460 domain-containing protein [Cytophagaceae bacterium]|nr:DUF1460 domain-containing protein [Cytophagaceae bacterium]
MKYWLLGILLFGLEPVFAQSDEEIFAEKMRLPRGQTVAETALTIAQSFVDAPYVSGTLESPDGEERLMANLREFDCTTFVENVLALARTRHTEKPDYQNFKYILQQIRYRGGHIRGYASRLHYFSDWLVENASAGQLVNLTELFGGEPLRKEVRFMTAHRNQYTSLSNLLSYNELSGREEEINRREIFFIPKYKTRSLEGQLQDGDLIGITSARPGLDVAHEGFVLRRNDRAYLLHASSEFGRVMLTFSPLSDYLTRNSGHNGVMVARLRN